MDKPLLILANGNDKDTINSISDGFSKKLGKQIDFEITEDSKITGGFIAIIDGKVYDASFESNLNALADEISGSDPKSFPDTPNSTFATVGAILKNRAQKAKSDSAVYEYGEVESFADDIAQIKGLANASYGELLEFDGGAVGLTLDLHIGGVSAALLGGEVSTSSVVHSTGRVASVCVGDELLGRVIDPIGRPLDGKELKLDNFMPVESPAPTIMDRAPVAAPLETGILAIDSMIPIGRGQRELIIGDRQTGKSSIALSAILNQKDTGVICVYCAIGQKGSTVSSIVHKLEKAGAMGYSVVVAAMGSDTAAMQYICPYAACTVAEYFMKKGKDVLVIYDDLSKHAVAYRAMSLLLRRPSGREAYPGDIFYLHSRLLERAAHIKPELGGGSITALPIVETMAGDISAYIPTNVISITDGQIYLESELFNAGIRPAINVGLSVSRVGRAAQHKAMRDVSGSLRLEVAQYREMAIFAQFGADVDEATAKQLHHGERLMELLKRPSDELLSLPDQVAILVASSEGLFKDFAIEDVYNKKEELLAYLHKNAEPTMKNIFATKQLSDEDKASLLEQFKNFSSGTEGAPSGEAE